MEDRINDLESRIAFQEHTIQELQDLVATHQKQLYDMEEALKVMARRLSQMSSASSGAGSSDDERPPHY
nr:SlyX family protein [uncultured Desulfuromonas sp.]